MKTKNLQLTTTELEMLKEEMDYKLKILRAEGWDEDVPEIYNQWAAILDKVAHACE